MEPTITAAEWIGLRRLIGRYVVLDEGAPVAMKIEQILAGAADAGTGGGE
jgi:hypothetical protein